MFKFNKSFVVLATSMALLGTTVTVAHADTEATYTYKQFTETDGYKDFAAASAAGAEYLSNQSGMTMTMSMGMTIGEQTTELAKVNIDATKTASKIVVSSSEQNMTSYFVDGAAYMSMSNFKDFYGPTNTAKVITRIPGSASGYVKLANAPGDLASMSPAELFSPSSDTYNSLLNSTYASLLDSFKFSEVKKTQWPNNLTDYEWDMVFDSPQGMSMTIHSKYTLDEHSMIVWGMTSTNSSTPMGNIGSGTIITMTVKNDLNIELPDFSKAIEDTKIKQVSNQILAEGKSTAKATAIVKKATELAKKAKAQISSKHLSDAAKALKYTVTKITNGVKLTATVSKVPGSLCVTAVKGKTSIKNC